MSLSFNAMTDASGATSLTYAVTRVIFTDQLGRVDCAQTACVIEVVAEGAAASARAPVEFLDTPLPPSPFSITLEGPHFLNSADATIGARITCDQAAQLQVAVFLDQRPNGGTIGFGYFVYQCAAGTDLHIFSDYAPGFQPGDVHAFFVLAQGPPEATKAIAADLGTVTLQSDADTAAALQAALAGPDGDAVRAKLIDDLNWRLTNNPTFRRVFTAALRG